MSTNRKRNLMSGVALTCGAILLGSFNAPIANAATQNDASTATTPAQTDVTQPASTGVTESTTEAKAMPASEPTTSPAGTMPQVDKAATKEEGVAQETVVGEDPDLGVTTLSPKQWRQLGIDPEESGLESSNVKLHWQKEPDVSKQVKAEGTAKLTYTDYSNSPTGQKKTVTVKVNVDVKNGKKKGTDEVRNRLTYIDQDHNKVIASYTWVGKKNDSKQAFDDRVEYAFDQTLEGLGYQVLSDGGSAGTTIEDLKSLGDHDKNMNKFVRLVSPDEPITWGYAQDHLGMNSPLFTGSSYNNLDITNPVNFIANVAALPAGTKVKWGQVPKYDHEGDIINNPTIKVAEPGREPITVTLTITDKAALMPAYVNMPTFGNETSDDDITATVGQNINPVEIMANKDGIARSVLENNKGIANPTAKQIAQMKAFLFNPRRWVWGIAPDLSKPGYTVAFPEFKALPGDDPDLLGWSPFSGYNGVRLRVVPKPESKPANPGNQPQPPKHDTPEPPTDNKPAYPIIIPDDPQPTPDEPDTPATDDENSVAPTQVDEQLPQAPVQVASVTRATSPIKATKQARASLPQTGEVTSVMTAVLAILTLGLSLVLFRKPKRQN